MDFKEYLIFKNIQIENKIDLISNKNSILKHLKNYLHFGGFPKICIDPRFSDEILKTYYETIIYKDIIANHNIRQHKLLQELLYYLTSNFTSNYSYKNLSKIFSADFVTIKEYLGYIEESKSFFSIEFFSYSLKVQNRNNKKIYCIDNGLRNAVSFKFSKDIGKMVENLVAINILKRYGKFYYWIGKNEVDFIIKNNSLSAINVIYTNEIKEREIQGLLEFKKENKNCKKLIIITKDLEKNQEGIKYIPLWKWFLAPHSYTI